MKRTLGYLPVYLPVYLLLCVLLLLGVACSPQSTGMTIVREQVMVEGEEIEVTRLIGGASEFPAIGAVATEPGAEGPEVALELAMEAPPLTLDPQVASRASEVTLVENLFAGLLHYNSATQEIKPELAASVETSADGRVWTFHLRDDVYWVRPGLAADEGLLGKPPGPSIYRPVVADDVVYALQRACDWRTGTPGVLVLFLVEGCEMLHSERNPELIDPTLVGGRAMDENTVAITLTEPASYFDVVSSLGILRPVPREIVEPFQNSAETWATLENLMISGPFIPSLGTEEGEQMVLRRNPFWPVEASGNVDTVTIFWRDTQEAYEMWLAKRLDVSSLPAGERETILGDGRLNSRLRLISNQSVFYLSYNFDSPVFSDSAVRRAFGGAIDREVLVEDVYGGRGVPMRHLTPPGVLGAPPEDIVGVGYNVDRARIEMERSSLQSCAFLPEIRYMVGATDLALHHAETLRGMWARELGCPEDKIVIEQVPLGTLLASTRPEAGEARPDIWDLGWASYFPDAHNWLGDVVHCTLSENRQNRPCGEADRLLEQAAVATSVEERRSLYRQAENLFFGETGLEPVTPLFVEGQYVLVHPWVTYQAAQFGGEQFDTYQLDATVKRLERQQ